MNTGEFEPIAERISALWPPRMNAPTTGAYYEVLEGLDCEDVREAVRLIAQTTRERRPTAGMIHDTALRLREEQPAAPQLPAADVDLLTPDEARIALAHNWRLMTAEQRRRAELLKPLWRIGLTWGELLRLTRITQPADFDAAVVQLRGVLTGRLVS